MRIAICDDVKEERQKIAESLRSVIRDFTADEFENGHDLLKGHSLNPYDLIILDILMPEVNGMDTAMTLRQSDAKTPVVFVSTSEEFGVQSYRVLAFDYLLKPIDKEQLKICLKRLLSQREFQKRYVSVNYCGVETNILLSNIQCLESNLHKVIFTLSENREIALFGKLMDYEPFLLKNGFCRCHKSYIVNLEQIDRLEGDVFVLACGKTVKISQTHLQSAKKAYFDYIFSAGI